MSVGLEYVVLAFILLFMTCGVAVPVLAWAGMYEVRRRELKEGLARLGAHRVLDAAGPSADAPARLSFDFGGHLIEADAVLRGDQSLWHVSLCIEQQSPHIPFALVSSEWGRPLPGARAMPEVVLPRMPAEGFVLRGGPEREDTGWEGHLRAGLATLGSGTHRLKQCVVTEGKLIFEVERTQMSAQELLVWVQRVLHFAEALGIRGVSAPELLSLPAPDVRIAGALSGNPVGLSG